MHRREFLTAVAAGATATAAAKSGIPRRPYKDGIELSVIGFGGIVVVNGSGDSSGWRGNRLLMGG